MNKISEGGLGGKQEDECTECTAARKRAGEGGKGRVTQSVCLQGVQPQVYRHLSNIGDVT